MKPVDFITQFEVLYAHLEEPFWVKMKVYMYVDRLYMSKGLYLGALGLGG